MNFRLLTIFWVFALIAASMAAFGVGGALLAATVVVFWHWAWNQPRNAVAKILVVVAVLSIFVALLLLSFSTVRSLGRESLCANHLKQLMLALHNYHDIHGSFPPAVVYENGQPMHSWRVLILPYIGEQRLYRQYNFDEPWNGPNNSKLAKSMPEIFACPSCEYCRENGFRRFSDLSENSPSYFAVVGPGTAWPKQASAKIADFTDGTSNTIMLVEANGIHASWLEPRDLTLQETIELIGSPSRQGHVSLEDSLFLATLRTAGRGTGWGDGHFKYLGRGFTAGGGKALCTVAGGEKVYDSNNQQFVGTKPRETGADAVHIIKWGKIYSCGLFVLLSIAPIMRVNKGSADKKNPDRRST